MTDSQGAAKAAPNYHAKIDTQTVEQDASWIGKRLSEPSTYAGLGVLLTLIFHISNADHLAMNLQTIGIALGSIILAVLAIIKPEAGNKKNGRTGASADRAAAILALCVLAGLLGHAPSAMARSSAHPRTPAVPLPVPDPRLAGLYDAARLPKPGALTAAQVQQNPLLLLQNFATTDLQAALADANAQTPPDTVAANCYSALLALKTNPAFALPSGQIAGAFTAIQKGRDLKAQLANLASPNGPLANLNAACAAWVNDNVTTLIAVGGAIGLVASPAGATAAAGGAVAAFNAQILGFLAALPK